ncbi:hypothetical protein D3C71_1243680 [compost metagenome]
MVTVVSSMASTACERTWAVRKFTSAISTVARAAITNPTSIPRGTAKRVAAWDVDVWGMRWCLKWAGALREERRL